MSHIISSRRLKLRCVALIIVLIINIYYYYLVAKYTKKARMCESGKYD